MKSKHIALKDLSLSLAKTVAERAAAYNADIRIVYRDKGANAKSLMGIIALSYKKGAELLLVAEGRDAARAIEQLKSIL
ncbi:MAG TPA: phosphocarrier protein HPr [Clostridiales bacterium]|nr:phosphocarrier protein HPr [Clostridiales bacterium]HCU56142.1 phosphocarrier protein HPr [Clostridiales bacterium]